MPGFTFPSVGRLGLSSPPSRPLTRSSVLRSAKTTASPSQVTSLLARFPVPRLAFHRFVFLSARNRAEGRPFTPGLFLYRSPFLFRFLFSRGVGGSLKFPGYPFMHMPRSSTPVVSPVFAIAHLGLMPSSNSRLSAFPVTITGYPCSPYGPQPYLFRSSVTRPTHSLHLASNTPYWICTQVHYRQGGYPRLMGLGRFPVLTHWVTTTNFTASIPIPKF